MDSRGIVETEKCSAHILYIPNHLSEEVSDFPLLYQEDKIASLKDLYITPGTKSPGLLNFLSAITKPRAAPHLMVVFD